MVGKLMLRKRVIVIVIYILRKGAVTIGGFHSIFLAFYRKNCRLQKLEASIVMPFSKKGVP